MFHHTPVVKSVTKKTKFNKSKENKVVSKCFTLSDQAFALIVLDNELGVWDAQLEKKGKETSKKQKGSTLRVEKKHTQMATVAKKGLSAWKVDNWIEETQQFGERNERRAKRTVGG